jgi:hypothetical protein
MERIFIYMILVIFAILMIGCFTWREYFENDKTEKKEEKPAFQTIRRG